MAELDIYELTDVQTLNGQTINNVFFYLQDLSFVTTNPTRSQTLAENWVAQKLNRIRAIQSSDVLHREVRVRNLFDEADAYSLGISLTGNAVGEATGTMSTFNAFAFSLNGNTSLTRTGAKRVSGVLEGWQNDGVFSGDSVQIAAMDAAAAAFEEAVTVGTVIQDPVFIPVIVKRVRTGTPGNYTYDLPSNQGEASWSTIVVALWKALITSQVSRKVGVGI